MGLSARGQAPRHGDALPVLQDYPVRPPVSCRFSPVLRRLNAFGAKPGQSAPKPDNACGERRKLCLWSRFAAGKRLKARPLGEVPDAGYLFLETLPQPACRAQVMLSGQALLPRLPSMSVPLISPSILSADFARLGEEVRD
jgi:hypothetical protein